MASLDTATHLAIHRAAEELPYWYSQADCCLFQRPPLSKQESILSCPYSQNPIKATSTTTTTAMTFRFIFEPLNIGLEARSDGTAHMQYHTAHWC